MNTPRSKPPARYTFKGIRSKAPFGMYTAGVNQREIACLIGEIAAYWPHVEESMIDVFNELIGTNDRNAARQIFRSIVNQKTRLTIMETLLERSPINIERDRFYDDALAEFTQLNNLRNKYIHGLWNTHEDTQKVFLIEDASDYFQFLEKREVTPGELKSALKRMMDLRTVISARYFSAPYEPPSPSSQAT